MKPKTLHLKLCQEGELLFREYVDLAEALDISHPAVGKAWDEWQRHKIGTSAHKGCPVCNGSKREAHGGK